MAVLTRAVLAIASAALLAVAAVPAAAADLQWSGYGTLPQGAPAFGLAQDPAAPGSVWAATNGQGLQHTEDGKAWKQAGAGALPARLWTVQIDPSKGPGGAPPMYVGSSGEGLFKSLDGGKSWQGSAQGLSSARARNVRSIALGVNMLVIATSDGAYKSGDGGRTWQAAGLAGYDVSAVAFAHTANPAVLLAGIDGLTNPGSRLVLSKDSGATWTPVKQGVPVDMVVSQIAAGQPSPGGPQRAVFLVGSAGVFKSDDGGQGWGQVSGLPAQGYGALSLSPSDPGIVYVGADGAGGGVWRSADRGATWTALPGGLSEKGVTAVATGRDNPTTVVTAAWSPDKGLSQVFTLSDTQAPPQGQPEGGVCPEPSCQGGTQPVQSATAAPATGPTPSRSASPRPCAAPSPAPSRLGGAGPGPVASAPAEPCPPGPPPPRQAMPPPLVIGVAVLLAALLLGGIVVARLRD